MKKIETVVNYELKLVTQWMKLNKLSLNTDKTNFVLFRSRQNLFDKGNLSIKFNNKKLKSVDYVNYLSWDMHINQLSVNGILSKLRHNAPLDVCLQIYYALFYSHLSYGCGIWGLTTKSNIDITNNLQKRCISIITFSDFQAHTNQLFIDLKLLKVEEIITTNQLKLIYEIIFDLMISMTYLNKIKIFISIKHQVLVMIIHVVRKSIKYQGPSIWNKMMKQKVTINKSKPIKGFKSTLHKHYLASLNYFLFTFLI